VKRVDIVFKRTGKFIMRGAASVDVDESTDWRSQAELLKLAELLPISVDYTDDNWEFDTIFIEPDNSNENS